MSIEWLDMTLPPVVVDERRAYVGAFGVTLAGPMDPFAYFANQEILNNTNTTSVLECVGPLSFKCTQAQHFAVTGGFAKILVNQTPVAALFSVRAGDRVEILPHAYRLRFYIGCKGGFDTPQVFDSQGHVQREGFGGIHNDGRGLDTTVPTAYSRHHGVIQVKELEKMHIWQARLDWVYRDLHCIPFIPACQWTELTTVQQHCLSSYAFQVSPDSNRMGIRMGAQALLAHDMTLANSQVVALGSIQITPQGEAIVMMNDKQTMGGYPVAGIVSKMGRARLAQHQPLNAVRFKQVSVENAYAQTTLFKRLSVR